MSSPPGCTGLRLLSDLRLVGDTSSAAIVFVNHRLNFCIKAAKSFFFASLSETKRPRACAVTGASESEAYHEAADRLTL
jgi:hypothetical protein